VDDVNALFNYFLPGDPLGPGPMPEQSFPDGSFYPLLLSAGFITTSLPEDGLGTYVAGVTRSVIPDLPGRVYFAIAGNYHDGLNEPYDFAVSNDDTFFNFMRLRGAGVWFYKSPTSPQVLPN
jgi:hypothetical protein